MTLRRGLLLLVLVVVACVYSTDNTGFCGDCEFYEVGFGFFPRCDAECVLEDPGGAAPSSYPRCGKRP